MKWINCPDCKGLLEIQTQTHAFEHVEYGSIPCPTCQDSDGNPTGRMCAMSDEQLEGMRDLWHTGFLTKAEVAAVEAELSHRKG